MRQFILALVISTICCCNEKKQQTPEDTGTGSGSLVITPLQDYSAYLAKADTTRPQAVSAAAEKYKQLFSDADTTTADSAFILFSNFYNSVTEHVAQEHIKDPKKFNSFNVPGKMPDTTNAYIAALHKNGFTLEMAEGNSYVKQDRSFMQQYFYPHVSGVMRSYLQQVLQENKKGFLADAALVIEPINLAERILFWEKFLKKHPSFYFNQDIRENQQAYITFLLEGTDNTPVFVRGTDKIQPAYRNAYEQIITVYPESGLAALVRPYFKALKNKDQAAIDSLLQQYKKEGIIYDYSA